MEFNFRGLCQILGETFYNSTLGEYKSTNSSPSPLSVPKSHLVWASHFLETLLFQAKLCHCFRVGWWGELFFCGLTVAAALKPTKRLLDWTFGGQWILGLSMERKKNGNVIGFCEWKEDLSFIIFFCHSVIVGVFFWYFLQFSFYFSLLPRTPF